VTFQRGLKGRILLGIHDCSTRNYWVLGLDSLSDILKNITFRKLDLLPTSGEGVGDTPLSRLERANLNHWATYVSITTAV
jgi:hypothetical protein